MWTLENTIIQTLINIRSQTIYPLVQNQNTMIIRTFLVGPKCPYHTGGSPHCDIVGVCSGWYKRGSPRCSGDQFGVRFGRRTTPQHQDRHHNIWPSSVQPENCMYCAWLRVYSVCMKRVSNWNALLSRCTEGGFPETPFENGFGYHMYVNCETTVYTIAIKSLVVNSQFTL